MAKRPKLKKTKTIKRVKAQVPQLSPERPKISISDIETNAEQDWVTTEGWFESLSTPWRFAIIVGGLVVLLLIFKACF